MMEEISGVDYILDVMVTKYVGVDVGFVELFSIL